VAIFIVARMADEESKVEAPAEEQEMTIFEAIRELLKKASHRNGLFRGINEVARAIDKGDAKICFIAENCELADYKNLIKALCHEKTVPLLNVSDRLMLGEWAGMCKVDASGTARNVVKCSSVALSFVDEETKAWKVVDNALQGNKA
jgi:small subunit ribosomal protein S12e